MLAPKVVNLKPPPINVRYKKGVVNENWEDVDRTVLSHHFNFSVGIMMPDNLSVPTNLRNTLTIDSAYYKVSKVQLYHLLSRNFIEHFVKKGEVSALSIGTWLDVDICACITPTGHLVLSVDIRTFESLGLVQSPAIKIVPKKDRYVVFVDLKHCSFTVGKNNYDRTYGNILESGLACDFIMSWDPVDERICPSSLGSYFHKLGMEVSECNLKDSVKINYNVNVPPISTPPEELFEWFAMCFLGAKFRPDNHIDEYVSSYEEPENCQLFGQVNCSQWTGFISSKRIVNALKNLREILGQCEAPWFGMHVQGFEDSPVSWNLIPHHFHTSGDNNYTLIFDKSDFIMSKVVTSCKSNM